MGSVLAQLCISYDYACVFVIGLTLGSFVTVCIHRLPRRAAVVSLPFKCPCCDHRLGWSDLVPIASFLMLRGRCRYCQNPISSSYPLVEMAAGLLLILAYHRHGLTLSFVSTGWFLLTLLAVTVIDQRHQIIPDQLILSGLIAGALLVFLAKARDPRDSLAGLLASGGLFLVLTVLLGGGIGGGDMKLAAVMGWYLGLWGIGLALLLGFVLAGTVGATLLMAKRKKPKDWMPFGPYLAAGGGLSALWYEEMLLWWFKSM